MRIIAGTFRSRKISAPPGNDTRPTTDRVRESLFSILGSVRDLTVWDAFAGSGALGLESLSRGAAFAIFSEPDRRAASVIRSNIELLGVLSQTALLQRPFRDAIAKLPQPPDVIFVDPPYDGNLYEESLTLIGSNSSIGREALVVVEHRSNGMLSYDSEVFELKDSRRYGATSLTFLYKR